MSGMYIGSSLLLDDADKYNEVDVFDVARRITKVRPQLIKDMVSCAQISSFILLTNANLLLKAIIISLNQSICTIFSEQNNKHIIILIYILITIHN